jgi:hypothetical protein
VGVKLVTLKHAIKKRCRVYENRELRRILKSPKGEDRKLQTTAGVNQTGNKRNVRVKITGN